MAATARWTVPNSLCDALGPEQRKGVLRVAGEQEKGVLRGRAAMLDIVLSGVLVSVREMMQQKHISAGLCRTQDAEQREVWEGTEVQRPEDIEIRGCIPAPWENRP